MTIDRNDIDEALDFLSKFRDGDPPVSAIENHPFIQKLDQEPSFRHACQKSSANPYELAEAVARGLVAYHKDTDVAFNAKDQLRASKAAQRLLDILEHSSVLECEFEQLMMQDMLKRVCGASTPIRGHKTEGNAKQFRERVLIQELVMSTIGLNLSPPVISHLAYVVNINIKKNTVENIMRRKDFEKWENYSREYFEEAFIPYCEFRKKHP